MPLRLNLQQKDLFVSEMRDLVDKSNWFTQLVLTGPAHWRNENELYKWLKKDAGVPGKMNCWEAVLVAGAQARLWGKDYVEKAVSKVNGLSRLAAYMSRSGFVFPRGVYRAEDVGLIVMFGDLGEHFALTCGDGNVIELDKFEKGMQSIGEVSGRSPYCNNPRVHVAAPPKLEEL